MNMIGVGNHQAFQIRPGVDNIKSKIETLDLVNNLLCYGDSKGNVQLCQFSITETSFDIQEISTKKVRRKMDLFIRLNQRKLIWCIF